MRLGYRFQGVKQAHVLWDLQFVVRSAFFSDEEMAIQLIVRDRVDTNLAAHRRHLFSWRSKATLLLHRGNSFRADVQGFEGAGPKPRHDSREAAGECFFCRPRSADGPLKTNRAARQAGHMPQNSGKDLALVGHGPVRWM